MRVESNVSNGVLLRKLRDAIGLTAEDAAALMGVTVRMVTAWERGPQTMPLARLELLTLKIRQRQNGGEMVVVVRSDGISLAPIDVVTESNFVDIFHFADDTALIRSLATDPVTRQPYVHETRFDVPDNEHVLRITKRWKQNQLLPADGQLYDEAALAVAKNRLEPLLRVTKAAEIRNPRLRELKDQILVASREVEGAMTKSDSDSAQKKLNKLCEELMREAQKLKP